MCDFSIGPTFPAVPLDKCFTAWGMKWWYQGRKPSLSPEMGILPLVLSYKKYSRWWAWSFLWQIHFISQHNLLCFNREIMETDLNVTCSMCPRWHGTNYFLTIFWRFIYAWQKLWVEHLRRANYQTKWVEIWDSGMMKIRDSLRIRITGIVRCLFHPVMKCAHNLASTSVWIASELLVSLN